VTHHPPVHRFPLGGGRELRATRSGGDRPETRLLIFSVRRIGDGEVCSGPLAVREADLQAMATAIEVLRIETAIEGGDR